MKEGCVHLHDFKQWKRSLPSASLKHVTVHSNVTSASDTRFMLTSETKKDREKKRKDKLQRQKMRHETLWIERREERRERMRREKRGRYLRRERQ